MVMRMSQAENVVVVGENTIGCLTFGNLSAHKLPNSRLTLCMPINFGIFLDREFREQVGLAPDLWVPAADAVNYAVAAVRAGTISTEQPISPCGACRQVLAEFFTSMLVLSASFKYKPARATRNYLYFVDGKWTLSLIAPDEWSAEHRAGFAGVCQLQPDMTWTIEPSELTAVASPISVMFAGAASFMLISLPSFQTVPSHQPLDCSDQPAAVPSFASELTRELVLSRWSLRIVQPSLSLYVAAETS